MLSAGDLRGAPPATLCVAMRAGTQLQISPLVLNYNNQLLTRSKCITNAYKSQVIG